MPGEDRVDVFDLTQNNDWQTHGKLHATLNPSDRVHNLNCDLVGDIALVGTLTPNDSSQDRHGLNGSASSTSLVVVFKGPHHEFMFTDDVQTSEEFHKNEIVRWPGIDVLMKAYQSHREGTTLVIH